MIKFSLFLGVFLCAFCAKSAELIVDCEGKTQGAFKTIKEALQKATSTDIITIKAGVYHENILLSLGGTEEQPFVIQGAEGERVIISGFRAIKDWKDMGNGIYSASVEGELRDLFVGLKKQQCSRWPDNNVMLPISKVDKDKFQFTIKGGENAPFLKEIAKDVKNAHLFFYYPKGNLFVSKPIDKYDDKSGNLVFSGKNYFSAMVDDERNSYCFMNHVALIKRAGHWAYVAEEKDNPKNKRGTVFFMPSNKEELENTQYRYISRPMISIWSGKGGGSNIIFRNLEVTGGNNTGIDISTNVKNVTVDGCIVHNNKQNGIAVRNAENITVKNSIVTANYAGIRYASSNKGLIEGNEVSYNDMDGIIVAGNIGGAKSNQPETYNVIVKNNYIHHHIIDMHPDNMQMYRGVNNTTIEGNLSLWALQTLMTEETNGVLLNNNIFMFCSAYMVIAGHKNSNNWEINNNTFMFPGYRVFSFTGENYNIKGNIIDNGMAYSESMKSEKNFFINKFNGYLVNGKERTSYRTVAEINAATGLEAGSVAGIAKFKNVPVAMVVGVRHEHHKNQILLRNTTTLFAIGDNIEINGDGVIRKVTALDGKILSFAPELPIPLFRNGIVVNWKQSESTIVDTSVEADSPILKDGKIEFGSSINGIAMQNGDLTGKGERTLPLLPQDIKDSAPCPNNPVISY